MLMTAKQTNELLLKNNDLKPASTSTFPEENASLSKTLGRSRGHEVRHMRGS